MQRAYGDDINFVGVAGRDDLDAIQEFIDTFGVGDFPHTVDGDGSVWVEYGITTQPSFAFINQDGMVETHIGALGIDGLTTRLDALATI